MFCSLVFPPRRSLPSFPSPPLPHFLSKGVSAGFCFRTAASRWLVPVWTCFRTRFLPLSAGSKGFQKAFVWGLGLGFWIFVWGFFFLDRIKCQITESVKQPQTNAKRNNIEDTTTKHAQETNRYSKQTHTHLHMRTKKHRCVNKNTTPPNNRYSTPRKLTPPPASRLINPKTLSCFAQDDRLFKQNKKRR